MNSNIMNDNIIRECDNLVTSYNSNRDSKILHDQVKLFLSQLPEKIEDLKLLRYLHYNLSFFETKKPIVMIVNVSNATLTPEMIINSKGTSGSEEALLMVGNGLAKRGWNVIILCGIDPKSRLCLPCNNPKYFPVDKIDKLHEKAEIVLSWRRTDFFRLREFCGGKVFHCPHDWFHGNYKTKALTGTVFLTNFQMEAYLSAMPELKNLKNIITGNGIEIEHFQEDRKRNQLRCLYCSSYNRGLIPLIDIWPDVRKKFPSAELHIYYGRECYGLLSDEELKNLVKKIEELKEDGVTEMGKVPHKQLAIAMTEASFLTMPSNFLETYCISATKALAAGCIPIITTVIEPSLLPNEIELIDRNAVNMKQLFYDKLIMLMEKAKQCELEILRETCKKYAKENLTWDISIDKLSFFLHNQ